MFDEFDKRFQEIRRNLNELKSLLQEVKLKLQTFERYAADTQYDLYHGKGKYRYAFNTVGEKNKDRIIELLVENFLRDVKTVDEFKDEIFTDRVVSLIRSENPILIELVGERVSVLIDMESIAGTLQDYSNGILYARNILAQERKTDKKITALQASNYWKNIIYLPKEEPYNTTIQLRLEGFGSLAPYWALIDQGIPQPLPSAYGGIPYPTSGPTRFVETSRREIEIYYNNLMLIEVAEYNSSLRSALSYYNKAITELRDLVRRIEKAIEDWIEVGPPGKSEYEIAEKALKDRLGEKVEAANPEKLKALIELLAVGEEIPGRKRIGGGVRPRLILLTREIDAELGRTPRL